MSKTVQEAIQELAIAVGECSVTVQNLVERVLGTRQTIEKPETIKRLAKRLNTKRTQSPYAIFDKFHKKQKRK